MIHVQVKKAPSKQDVIVLTPTEKQIVIYYGKKRTVLDYSPAPDCFYKTAERFSKKKYESPYENFIKLILIRKKLPFVVSLEVLKYLDSLEESVLEIDVKKERVIERLLNKDFLLRKLIDPYTEFKQLLLKYYGKVRKGSKLRLN